MSVSLRELEEYVDRLRADSAPGPGHLSVTLRDVEEGAVNLRRVGEALAGLKGEQAALGLTLKASGEEGLSHLHSSTESKTSGRNG